MENDAVDAAVGILRPVANREATTFLPDFVATRENIVVFCLQCVAKGNKATKLYRSSKPVEGCPIACLCCYYATVVIVVASEEFSLISKNVD